MKIMQVLVGILIVVALSIWLIKTPMTELAIESTDNATPTVAYSEVKNSAEMGDLDAVSKRELKNPKGCFARSNDVLACEHDPTQGWPFYYESKAGLHGMYEAKNPEAAMELGRRASIAGDREMASKFFLTAAVWYDDDKESVREAFGQIEAMYSEMSATVGGQSKSNVVNISRRYVVSRIAVDFEQPDGSLFWLLELGKAVPKNELEIRLERLNREVEEVRAYLQAKASDVGRTLGEESDNV